MTISTSDAARALGALGASKGGIARDKALTEARKVEIALMGVAARQAKRKGARGLETALNAKPGKQAKTAKKRGSKKSCESA